jgi:hypothetical protein
VVLREVSELEASVAGSSSVRRRQLIHQDLKQCRLAGTVLSDLINNKKFNKIINDNFFGLQILNLNFEIKW